MVQINPALSRDRQIERWLLIGLLLFAVLVRAPVAARGTLSLAHDIDGYLRLAMNLRERFSYQFSDSGPPTAQRPPLYPLLLVSVVGQGEEHLALIAGLHVVLGVGTVLLTVRLGRGWGLGKWRLLAGGLVACDPILLKQSTVPMSETLAAFLAALGLLALTALVDRPGMLRALFAGAALGLAILCRPTFLAWAVVAPWAAWWLLPRTARRVLLVVIMCASAAATVAPWGIRNLIRFGRPIITTTHGGFTLHLANNPEFYDHLRSAPREPWDATAFNQLFGPLVVRTLTETEIEWDRENYQAAWKAIGEQPVLFVRASLFRIARLWDVLPIALVGQGLRDQQMRYATAAWYALEFAFALAGLWSLGRQLLTSPWLFCLLLAVCFTAVHSVYWTDMRMRAPLAPGICLAAAAGVGWTWAQIARRNQQRHKQLQVPQ